MLELRGLGKSWPDFDLEVSLAIELGEITALLGPSGCGKSTLLRLISGLEAQERGKVLVDGHDVTDLPTEKRGIGMVFQDLALFPHMSVRRNIEYGPRMHGVSPRIRRELARRLAESFEIEDLLDRRPYSLSGGERQRVAIARALAVEPSIVLFDEPLSSLDANLRRRLRTEIAESLRRSRVTALIVTHDAEEAMEMSDRIFLMRDGRIEAASDPETLANSPPTAWCASFLELGPVLDISSIDASEAGPIAETALGPFLCQEKGSAGNAAEKTSLFVPARAPRLLREGRSTPELSTKGRKLSAANRLGGRVLSSSISSGARRITLACPIAGRGLSGNEMRLTWILPLDTRLRIGEYIEFELEPSDCMILPGAADPS